MGADTEHISPEERQVQRQEKIRASEIKLLFPDAQVGILVTFINAALLAYVQWDHVLHSTLIAWMAYLGFVLLARSVLIQRYNALAPEMPELKRWGTAFIVGATATGIAWGLAGVFLVPESSLPHQIFTTFVLGGMISGAMTTLSPVFPGFVLYLLTAVTPLTLVFFRYGDTIHVVAATMMVLYMVFLFNAGRKQNRFIRASVELTLDKGELAERLAGEKRQAEAFNKSLTHEITERTQAEAALKYHLEFEKLLTNISTGFINLPAHEIDAGINRALAQLGPFLGMDRGYVFLLVRDQSAYRNTHEWSVEGVGPAPEEFREVDRGRLPWWLEYLQRFESVHISHVQDLPPEVVGKDHSFHLEPVKSLALVPLVASGMLMGFVGFESFRQEKAWSEETQVLLKVIAEMFVNALERKRTYEELEQARAAAEAAAKAKAQFLANMSHEIRTPLHGVLGMLGLLRDGQLQEKELHYADVAHRSAEMLVNIIDDILDYSRMEAGKLHLEQRDFQLSEVVEESVVLLSRQAAVKGLELACFIGPEVPDSLRGDAPRLRQVLVNLVGNAVKFTSSGEVSVRVTLDAQEEDRAFIRFEVCDTGIGISPEALKQVFDPFTQADPSTTRKYGGTGLGLAISHQLVKLMGGEMGVSSEPGRGSTFWLRIGFDRLNVQLSRTPGVLYDLRVLVVGNRKTTRLNLSRYLESWGARSRSVQDLEEAGKLLRTAADENDPFTVVLMDAHGSAEGERAFVSGIKGGSVGMLPYVVILSPVEDSEAIKGDLNVDAVLAHPASRKGLYETLVQARNEMRGAPRRIFQSAETVKVEALGGSLRVLLVEDNPINQRLGREMLMLMGYEADVAANGRICLEILGEKRYDLILMDCQMPEMDGYEATRSIRWREKNEGGRKIPIIALTANAMHGDRERCLESGMDDYIAKPFTLQTLKDMLTRWLPQAAR